MPGYSASGLSHPICHGKISKNTSMNTYFYFHEKDENKLHYKLISGLDYLTYNKISLFITRSEELLKGYKDSRVQYTLFQNGHYFSDLLFAFKLALVASFLNSKYKRIFSLERGNKG